MSRLIMLWVCSCEWLKQEVNLAPVSYILFIHSMYCMNSLNSEPFVGRDTLKMSAFIHVKWEINTAASSVGSVCMFRYWVQLCFLYSRSICLSCMLQLNIFLRRKGRVRNVWKSGSGEDGRKKKEKRRRRGRFGFHSPCCREDCNIGDDHTLSIHEGFVFPEIVSLVLTSTCWPDAVKAGQTLKSTDTQALGRRPQIIKRSLMTNVLGRISAG